VWKRRVWREEEGVEEEVAEKEGVDEKTQKGEVLSCVIHTLT
jgi:hypothetical protein